MPVVELEKEIKVIKLETIESYLKRNFLREKEEFQVDFNAVGKNMYRINFWSTTKKNDTVSDNYISRSFYVALKKCGTEWSHAIK